MESTNPFTPVQFLTVNQCARWLRQRGADADDSGPQFSKGWVSSTGKFTILSDAGRRVALARVLWEWIEHDSPEILIWPTYWHAWPSGQYLPLAATLRLGFGETRPMEEAPGVVVRTGESADGLSMFVVAVLYLWDCWLFNANGSACVFVSHDEFGLIYCKTEAESVRLQHRMAEYNYAIEPREERESDNAG
jgi:hypothetical protein